jgi:hypothetical protein
MACTLLAHRSCLLVSYMTLANKSVSLASIGAARGLLVLASPLDAPRKHAHVSRMGKKSRRNRPNAGVRDISEKNAKFELIDATSARFHESHGGATILERSGRRNASYGARRISRRRDEKPDLQLCLSDRRVEKTVMKEGSS